MIDPALIPLSASVYEALAEITRLRTEVASLNRILALAAETADEHKAALIAAETKGARQMREACRKYHADAAEIMRRDARLAAEAGCCCSDSYGSLDYYASLHEGHADAIAVLALPGEG